MKNNAVILPQRGLIDLIEFLAELEVKKFLSEKSHKPAEKTKND